jgi:hypothetical protein
VSTPDPWDRREARQSDSWPPPTDDYADDRWTTDTRQDQCNPYYRELRDLDDERDTELYRDSRYDEPRSDEPDKYYYDDTRDSRYDDRDSLYDEPASSRAIHHILSAFLCLVLTPIGLVAMTYGADRYWKLSLQHAGAESDLRGLIAIGAGAVLLLAVAALGALSPAGPLLSGIVWGLIPAGLYLVYPGDTGKRVLDLTFLPDSAVSGTLTWLGYSSFLMVGALLIGAGLAAAIRGPAPARD